MRKQNNQRVTPFTVYFSIVFIIVMTAIHPDGPTSVEKTVIMNGFTITGGNANGF